MRSGYAVIDYMGAYAGAFGVMTALYHRDCRDGSGQVIDLALYEPGFRASEDAMLAYSATGRVRERSGNINLKVVPAGDFETADGKRVTIHAGTEPLLRRLAGLMNEPALCDDPRFSTHAKRVENQDALYARIAAWVGRQNLADLMAALVSADIPASPLMSVADIAADPHFRGRGTIMPVQDEDHGEVLMAAPIPRLSETPGSVRSLGPRLGSANEEIFGGLLGMNRDEIARLRQSGTI